MTRSLIIGAGGQVGTQLMVLLGQQNCVPAFQASTGIGVYLDLKKIAGDHPNDVTSTTRMLEDLSLSAIYCAGGMTNVEQCEYEGELAIQINEVGPAHIALAARGLGIPFIYYSTDYVFDGRAGPYSENDAPHAVNAYGESKLRAERSIIGNHPGALIIRTTVVYGPDRNERNFVSQLRRNLSSGTTMRVPDDQFSTPTFNVDLAHVSIALAERGTSGIVHVAGSERMSRLEFARRAARFYDLPDRLIVGSSTSELGQRAERPLQAGLRTNLLERLLPSIRMRSVEEALAHGLEL